MAEQHPTVRNMGNLYCNFQHIRLSTVADEPWRKKNQPAYNIRQK